MFNLTNPSRALTAKNLGVRGKKAKIHAIVLHDTAGGGTHNDTRYLANPGDGRNVSVDFTVERDGSIYQLNPELATRCCYHAGRATALIRANNSGGPNYRNADVNRVTVGIEIVQKADMSLKPMWPREQVDAVARLCVDLCGIFNLSKTAIVTHQQIITDGSRSDPRKFPFADVFWPLFNEYALKPVDGIIVPAAVVKHVVAPGDTLYSLANRYSTKIERIKALNNMNTPSNEIFVGQELTVKE